MSCQEPKLSTDFKEGFSVRTKAQRPKEGEEIESQTKVFKTLLSYSLSTLYKILSWNITQKVARALQEMPCCKGKQDNQ